jgi:hypothetical protein
MNENMLLRGRGGNKKMRNEQESKFKSTLMFNFEASNTILNTD